MMNNFIFENKTKVYFGKGGVKEYLGGLLANFGETVMLAYGGGSIKCNGVYDEIMGILNAQGKCVVEFSGIMSNPTYAKVQEGAKLARASAMAENGVLKIGKVTDFQAHQIEHQLGAYTNCNHGASLAVIHPVLYRHIYKSGTARFTRWAQNVWGIAPKGSDEETAAAGIDALAAFIKEIGARPRHGNAHGLSRRQGSRRGQDEPPHLLASRQHGRSRSGGRWSADQLCRAWHPRRHRLPRRGGFYQHHRWLLQEADP